MTLNERVRILEAQIYRLLAKQNDLSANTEEKTRMPYTKHGGLTTKAFNHPYDVRSGLGSFGGTIYWNDAEIGLGLNDVPETPTEGYHKHTHSRFSGGALINGGVEIVEYAEGEIENIHSQQFLQEAPEIAEEENSLGQPVKKIGQLTLVFNPNGGYDENGDPIGTWGIATYEIDVESCYFIKRRKTANRDAEGNTISGEDIGDIQKDENGNEMKSPLYMAKEDDTQDVAQSSVIWDKNGRNGQGCWRLLAVYAPEEEVPEE